MFKKIGILLIGVWCVHQMAFANTINESSGEQCTNMNSKALTNSECWLSLMVKDQRVLKPMFLFFLPDVFDGKEVDFLLSSYSKEEMTDNAQAVFEIAHRCDQVEVTQANKVQISNKQNKQNKQNEENEENEENEQFNAGYRCFLDRYSQDSRLIQSFIQPESEESKANLDALIQKYGQEKYDLSINALVDYYAECQSL
jgi:hypothetical protein